MLATAIRAQLADRRLVGRRGDGEAVNWLFCANGKYRLESSGSERPRHQERHALGRDPGPGLGDALDGGHP